MDKKLSGEKWHFVRGKKLPIVLFGLFSRVDDFTRNGALIEFLSWIRYFITSTWILSGGTNTIDCDSEKLLPSTMGCRVTSSSPVVPLRHKWERRGGLIVSAVAMKKVHTSSPIVGIIVEAVKYRAY